jgi:thiol:disulfide interchange protein DsbD
VLLALLLTALLAGCETDFAAARSQGGLTMFLAAFLGGMAVTLTPCVYPLIPITVSIFGGLPGEDLPRPKKRARAVMTGTTYILGIALTYSTLGLLAGLAGKGAVGDHLGSWYVVVPLAVLFVALAASMFGAFELQLPAAWQARLSGVGGAGLWGGLAMGLVAGLLAAPCTGPVISGILLYIASTGDGFLGFWLLFTFSMGLGLMFMVIAAFASVMPRSGPWMEGVKSVFGVLMLVAALYYLSALVKPLSSLRVREAWILWTGLGLAAFGVVVGGIHLSFRDRRPLGILRKAAGVLALTAGLFLALQFARGSNVKAQYTSIPEGLAAARKAKRPALIDFWATWCEKCIELERETLDDPRVAKVLRQRFVFIKKYCSEKSAAIRRTQKKWGARNLPTLALVDSRGRHVKSLVGKISPERLLRELEKID